ncbi:MAG: VCBS domain-containing protein [Candidatus Endonucleobacter bathymodioli]|uniref:VCBS domain-containing protein n=1 Tax=Candidatus Endonucleibacter bathymodioli TaxID=539814 RepID=A0AA90NZF1_9GAMM|nr:VCBS domain-containing protein [Candidatus Endonucleobacter bathymodioli]
MKTDLENITTIQAPVQHNAGKAYVELLQPFASQNTGDSKVSHLKWISGNEVGVSLSLGGTQLEIDLDAYDFIIEDSAEELRYQYRIDTHHSSYSQNTVTITIRADANDHPVVFSAILTTDEALDADTELNETTYVSEFQDPISEVPPSEGFSIVDTGQDKAEHTISTSVELMSANLNDEYEDGSDYDSGQIDGGEVIDGLELEPVSPEEELTSLVASLSDGTEKEYHELSESTDGLELLVEQLGRDHEVERNSTDTFLQEQSEQEEKVSPILCQEMMIASAENYVFELADFDPKGHGLEAVRLDGIPEKGHLLYNKEPVIVGQEIPRLDLLTGRLRFESCGEHSTSGEMRFLYSVCYKGQTFDAQMNSDPSVHVSLSIDVTANISNVLVASGNIGLCTDDLATVELISGTVDGLYGALTINSNGYWSYEADSSQPALVQLGEGEFLYERILVSAEHGHSCIISLTIIGPWGEAQIVIK